MKAKLLIVLLLISNIIKAQNRIAQKLSENKQNAVHYGIFNYAGTQRLLKNSNTETQDTIINLNINNETFKILKKDQPERVTIDIPMGKNSTITLDLKKHKIHSTRYNVINSENNKENVENGVYYNGIIRGDENSITAINLTSTGLNGFISSKNVNIEISESKNINTGNQHNLVNSASLIEKWSCSVPNEEGFTIQDSLLNKQSNYKLNGNAVQTINCRAIEIYFEADYSMFQQLGSIQNTTDYVNQLFNQVSTLYENEGIDVNISQIKIWNTADPYNAIQFASVILSQFTANMNQSGFNGDLAHFLSFKRSGGIAYLDVLKNRAYATGVSMSLNTQQIGVIPTYSNPINVVTHELGHNLGSPHTHWCGWPGGPIDNCYVPEGGDCSIGPKPNNGGTIMSYCHLLENVGINFSNGFGSLPGDLIRTKVSIFLGNNLPPNNVTVSEIYTKSAYLEWGHNYKEGIFNIEFKPTNENIWKIKTLSNSWVRLDSLLPATNYNYRIKSSCSNYINGSFSTTNTQEYCAPSFYTFNDNLEFYINGLTIDERVINNNTKHNGLNYTFFNTSKFKFLSGNTYNFELKLDGNYNGMVTIWIDFNGNNTFEVNEIVFSENKQYARSLKSKLTIPTGQSSITSAKMRILLSAEYLNAPQNPCGVYYRGETEDYLVDIENCVSQLPAPNNLIISNNTGKSVNLDWGHTSSGPYKVKYKLVNDEQWKTIWTETKNITVSGLDPNKTYNCQIEAPCSAIFNGSFTTSTSNYCIPTYSDTYCNFGLAINKVIINNVNLSENSGCSTNSYTFFNTNNLALTAGNTYSFSLQTSNNLNYFNTVIYIDYDGNSDFESDERVYASINSSIGTINGSFTIPFGIGAINNTRLRIMTVNDTKYANPCSIYGYGEAEDYLITINSCSTNNTAAPTNLVVSGTYSNGTNINWQYNTTSIFEVEYKLASSNSWIYAGQTDKLYMPLSGLRVNSLYDFRVKKACSSNYVTGSFSTTIDKGYCIPNHQIAGCTNGYGIKTFKVNNDTLSYQPVCTSESFQFLPQIVKNLVAGETYNISIDLRSYYSAQQASLWIDINDNGIFEDSEKFYTTSEGMYSIIQGSIKIPYDAVPKNSVRMRLIMKFDTAPTNPCDVFTLPGESRDYLVNILPCPANNNPAPINVIALNIFDKGGLIKWEYQSKKSFQVEYKIQNSTNWVNLGVTDTTFYSLKGLNPSEIYDVRIRAVCSENYTNFKFSTKPLQGYCTTTYTEQNCGLGLAINTVSLNQKIYSSNSGCSTTKYEIFGNQYQVLNVGETYPISITLMAGYNNAKIGVWIDLNGNGVFEGTEKLITSNAFSLSYNGSITIPQGVPTISSTRMRIISNFGPNSSAAPNNPCGTYFNGETEDYIININNPCPSIITLTNQTVVQGTVLFEASSTVGKISASNILQSPTNTTYRAKTIELNPNFEVKQGATFKAEIGGCL